MPELPEVETIRRGLSKRSAGQKIIAITGRDSRLFRNNLGGLSTVVSHLRGLTIQTVERRGKFMWFRFEREPQVLVVHLGMSGQVRINTAKSASGSSKHEHLRLTLQDGSSLSFIDPRMFGHLTLSAVRGDGLRDIPVALAHIAPDLLEDAWLPGPTIVKAILSGRHVKTILLDQGIVSGIGNIYADEGLYRANTHGSLRGRELSKSQWELVLGGCAAVMSEAVQVGGTSFDSLYVDADGNPGYFSRLLAVYGRAGQKCYHCGTIISRTIIDGRSHFYCRTCQLGMGDSDQTV